MRYSSNFILPVLLFLITFPGFSQETTEEKFKEGVSQYSAGNFEKAVELWTDLYNTGYRSPELNFNIGNAFFKLNNLPGAILYYERASLLDPVNEDINYNLQIARSLTVDRFREIPELFFVKWYNLVSLMLSSDTWSLLGIAMFILSLSAVSVYIYSGRYATKVAGFWLGIIFLSVSVLSVAFSIRNKNQVFDGNKAIIFSPVVNGKSSPDAGGTDLFVLHEGTKVSIEDKVGEWYEIRLSDGNKGWVTANSLNII